jgi:hypothetical protein
MDQEVVSPSVIITPEITNKLASEEVQLLQKELSNVREEMLNNPYVLEALRVLPVRGYRSAIGSYWNAVVDDLRKKIIHRSLDLFNKEIKPRKDVKIYEDFQDHVLDADLIEGAYKIGVIGWEAKKLLQQARETRNVFDGHPNSSDPSLIKVLNLIGDCNKYVLSQEYPTPIVDINAYLSKLESLNYDRNTISAEQALGDLPSIYKSELINKLYTAYTDENSSTTLRANIEFCIPILWNVLSQEDRQQVGRRLDRDIVSGDREKILNGTNFFTKVDGLKYVSNATRKVLFEPVIKQLEENLDDWDKEGAIVLQIEKFGSNIPEILIPRYVSALTLTYVGYKGSSLHFSRRNFYSDVASPVVQRLFEKFDDRTAQSFVDTIKTNAKLKARIQSSPEKLSRLRTLANILLNRLSLREDVKVFLELLRDETKTDEFYRNLRSWS